MNILSSANIWFFIEEQLHTNMYNRKQGRSLSVEDWFKIINFQEGHIAIEYSIQDTVTSSGETNIDGPFAHSNRASERLAAVQTQRVKQMRILHCQNTFGSHSFQPPEPILWDKFNLHLLPACSCYLVQKPLFGSHGAVLTSTFSCSCPFAAWNASGPSLFYPKSDSWTHNWFITFSSKLVLMFYFLLKKNLRWGLMSPPVCTPQVLRLQGSATTPSSRNARDQTRRCVKC